MHFDEKADYPTRRAREISTAMVAICPVRFASFFVLWACLRFFRLASFCDLRRRVFFASPWRVFRIRSSLARFFCFSGDPPAPLGVVTISGKLLRLLV